MAWPLIRIPILEVIDIGSPPSILTDKQSSDLGEGEMRSRVGGCIEHFGASAICKVKPGPRQIGAFKIGLGLQTCDYKLDS